jgi:hypothetical protein
MEPKASGVAVAGALALGMYSCTRAVPGSLSSEEDEEDEEDEEGDCGLPAHLGGSSMEPPSPQPEQRKRPAATVSLSVCSSCAGSQTVLSDLEDLCAFVSNVRPRAAGCMGACGMGPNVASQAADGHRSLHSGLTTLDETVRVLKAVARWADPGSKLTIPDEALARIRLRSDGTRLANSMDPEDSAKAELLFTQAIDIETSSPGPVSEALTVAEAERRRAEHLRKLYMLRSSVRGSQALRDYDGAIADCDAVIEATPEYSEAFLQKAKLLRRARRSQQALACFEQAHLLGSSPAAPEEEGFRMDRHMLTWLAKQIDEVRDRLQEDAAIQAGEFGAADAGDENCEDSGDGSGRWLVEKIEGLAADSCVYHLRNHPPAVPHSYPHSAWHVNVRFGGTVRECVKHSLPIAWTISYI